ncbi:MAG TPA: GGDEF domain-containing protein [Xanthobacteraceae bacterium]|jgi:diguanylate cyclase (GGDEF)-like protein|nr:GGDEF domain-containing protein [Xanthobacteraceae bacterium]
MAIRPAKPGDKSLSRPKTSSKPTPGGRREKIFEPERPQRPRPPSRLLAARLAAEVDALTSKLAASQVRICELEARVDIDPLTDVLNRRGFERELKRSLAYVKRYGTSVALLFIDLDGFKPVNDRHGHAAGDAMLKAIAEALTSRVRASDVVARIGGDEFAVLLWNLSPEDATAKAHALEAAIYATPLRWAEATLVVGASAGVALLGPLDSPTEMMAAADAAMYARKAERNPLAAARAGRTATASTQ